MRVLLVAAAVLAVLAPQAFAAKGKAAAKTIDCAKVHDFSVLDKKCCKKPIGDLGIGAALTKCNPKKDKALNKWLNDYMLYKFQIAKSGNIIDLETPTNKKLVCQVGPFLSCIFNATGILLPNGTFDTNVVKTLLTSNKDPDWQPMLESIALGVKYSDYIPPLFAKGIVCPAAKRGSAASNTSLSALILIQYLQMTIVQLCPDFTEPDTKNKCAENMEIFYTCQSSMWDNLFARSSGVINFSEGDDTSVSALFKKNPKEAVEKFKKQLAAKSG